MILLRGVIRAQVGAPDAALGLDGLAGALTPRTLRRPNTPILRRSTGQGSGQRDWMRLDATPVTEAASDEQGRLGDHGGGDDQLGGREAAAVTLVRLNWEAGH